MAETNLQTVLQLYQHSMLLVAYKADICGSLRGKWGQHSRWMLVWVSSMLGITKPMSGTDPESHFDLNVVPLDTNQKERRLWLPRTVLLGVWGLSVLVGCQPGRGVLR